MPDGTGGVSAAPARRRGSGGVPAALWRTAFAAALAFYLDAATLITVAISLPVWRDHFGLSSWQVGAISSGLTVAVAVGAGLGGRLGDAVGRSVVFTVDLMIFVVGTLLVAFAGQSWMLLCGVVVVGLAAGADVPTALAVVSDAASPAVRGRLIGLTQVFWIAAILLTYALGFAVSRLGFLGTQLLVVQLVVVAVVTLTLRLIIRPRTAAVETRPGPPDRTELRHRLRGSKAMAPLLATGAFYLCWNVASTTLGSFGTYFLRTVTRLDQTQATGLVLVTFPLALVMSVIFVRLADTRWRDRLFVVAMVLQVAAFAVGGVTGGTAAAGMALLILLYSLSNVFAGEAIWKVWSQLLLSDDVRSTGLGLTYGLARGVAAAFLLVVPAVIEVSGGFLMWILTGCVIASGVLGLLITRRPAWHARLNPGVSVE